MPTQHYFTQKCYYLYILTIKKRMLSTNKQMILSINDSLYALTTKRNPYLIRDGRSVIVVKF